MRHRAKFRVDRSNRCWDMAIFRFVQDDGRPPSWICDERVWTTHEGHLVVFMTVQNLVGIDAVVLNNIHAFRFHQFGRRTPIYALKIGVLGIWPPKWGGISTKPPKGTFLVEKTSYDVEIVKIGPPVRPVRVTKRPKINKNSSGDEIANVNFFYNIAHVEASAYAHWTSS